MRSVDPAVNFLIVLIIGIAAGLLFDRFAGPSGLVRQFAGARAMVTSALIGIAGAFIGFHLAALSGMIGLAGFALYVGAAAGAAIVLMLWRMIR
jgi:uncharacterized membrane protein YeaQ/YmgE (transglycosylase-associated protein family)